MVQPSQLNTLAAKCESNSMVNVQRVTRSVGVGRKRSNEQAFRNGIESDRVMSRIMMYSSIRM